MRLCCVQDSRLFRYQNKGGKAGGREKLKMTLGVGVGGTASQMYHEIVLGAEHKALVESGNRSGKKS